MSYYAQKKWICFDEVAMDGVVTLLPEPFYSDVETIWADLQLACNVRGILATPVPHFSWHVAEGYDKEQLLKNLTQICAETRPFTIRTAGLGIFTGDIPVVYIPLVKNRTLMDFHDRVWSAADGCAFGSRNYYGPEDWMPHITLVFQDVCVENIACIASRLFNHSFSWEMEAQNLALIGQAPGMSGSVFFKLPFS